MDFGCVKNVGNSTDFECGIEFRHIPTDDDRQTTMTIAESCLAKFG